MSKARKSWSREELKTPQGRRRAWRQLLFTDHGVLRYVYDNSHEISPGKMWRSYQPSPSHLEKWARKGIKTVINLRGEKPSGFLYLEEDACERLELEFVTFKTFSREPPSKEILHGARALFDNIAYPAVMHCKSGADRAGLMSALYLFFREGVAFDRALEQLSFRYGHVRQGKTGVIDFALEQYLDYAKANGKSLSSVADFFDWVDNVYDPAAAKEQFRSTGWGDFLTEKVLRRE